MNPQLSVIIPTYNKIDRLILTLFCLDKQLLSTKEFEVIVINDGSSDGTSEYLNSLTVNFQLSYYHQKNSGQAKARNLGLSKAKGRIIVFLDDDLIIPPDFLKSHLAEHHSDYNQVVLGRIFRINSSDFYKISQLIFNSYDEAIHDLMQYTRQDLYLDMVETIFKKKLYDIAWICFTGGNSSVKKELIEKVGYFDSNFYRWGPEDIELGYRFHEAGIPFKYCPNLYNFHMDVIKDRNQMLIDTASNLKYLKKKYPNNDWIKDYIDFTSGGFSLEEFYSRRKGIPFHPEDYDSLFRFRPFDYINLKSEVNK
ncbi:MAG: glycosyltransferase [Firmicutes bacterium]|nr:glycosyltransferase [Bacillota bacterium]